jgi:hypothetical protein
MLKTADTARDPLARLAGKRAQIAAAEAEIADLEQAPNGRRAKSSVPN